MFLAKILVLVVVLSILELASPAAAAASHQVRVDYSALDAAQMLRLLSSA